MTSYAFHMSKTIIQNRKDTNTAAVFNAENYPVSTGDVASEEKIISEAKKITNLNTDCMEIIFEHLELEDLLNLADSGKQFYSAACLVYKRQYANSYMIFDTIPEGSCLESPYDECAVLKNKIFITKPLMLLKLLRNFGHLIMNLGVSYIELNAKICAEIEQNYFAKYCSHSIQRLYLESDQKKTTFENLQKSLKNVTTFGIVLHGDYKKSRYLNESKLPNLRHIIYVCYDAIREMSEKIDYRHVEYFSLCPILGMVNFPFILENLKHFCLYGNIDVNNAFCEFIGNMEYLKTLKIICFQNIGPEISKIFELQNILSNVVEMEIKFQKSLSSELILRFLKRSQNLKTITFQTHHPPTLYRHEFQLYSSVMQNVNSNLENEWTSYIITPIKAVYNIYSTRYEPIKCYVLKK